MDFKKGEATSRCKISPCGVSLLAASAASLALCVYTAQKLVAYTPVYRPLECIALESALDPLKMDANWVNATGTMRKSCMNPNAYAVAISQTEPGQVFVKDGDNLVPVGRSDVEPA